MKTLGTILICALVSVTSSWAFFNYAPLSLFESHKAPQYGSTVTTILGTDTISGSRTTINTNFANLNATKAEISDVSSTTSLPFLATIGTITTGVWNGTPITVPFGGTGSTTLSSNQVLLGNGSGNVKLVSGFGSSGQALVSNGNGVVPTWQSLNFDTTQNYSLTGTWTFGNTATFNASSIFNVAPTFGIFSATSTGNATSSIVANLTIGNNASTSNLVISKNCTGCSENGRTQVTNTGTGPSTIGSTVSVTATCSGTMLVQTGGGTIQTAGSAQLTASYPSASNAWTVTYNSSANTSSGTETAYAICVNP